MSEAVERFLLAFLDLVEAEIEDGGRFVSRDRGLGGLVPAGGLVVGRGRAGLLGGRGGLLGGSSKDCWVRRRVRLFLGLRSWC